jgi:hypothetical protein
MAQDIVSPGPVSGAHDESQIGHIHDPCRFRGGLFLRRAITLGEFFRIRERLAGLAARQRIINRHNGRV